MAMVPVRLRRRVAGVNLNPGEVGGVDEVLAARMVGQGVAVYVTKGAAAAPTPPTPEPLPDDDATDPGGTKKRARRKGKKKA